MHTVTTHSQAAKAQTDHYHQKKTPFGYSVVDNLPQNAKSWIDVCLSIIRAKIKQCMGRPTGLSCVQLGKPGTPIPKHSSFKRVVSPNLGEYPFAYVDLDIDRRVTSLLKSLGNSEQKMKTGKKVTRAFERMESKLEEYCTLGEKDTYFPFSDEDAYGLSIDEIQQTSTR